MRGDSRNDKLVTSLKGCFRLARIFADSGTGGGGGTCFPWKESFDAKKFDMAFTRFGKYQAAGNFFWINHRFTVHRACRPTGGRWSL